MANFEIKVFFCIEGPMIADADCRWYQRVQCFIWFFLFCFPLVLHLLLTSVSMFSVYIFQYVFSPFAVTISLKLIAKRHFSSSGFLPFSLHLLSENTFSSFVKSLFEMGPNNTLDSDTIVTVTLLVTKESTYGEKLKASERKNIM